MSHKTTFSKFKEHLDSTCGIALETHLEFHKKSTIKNYALASSILVLYHYAKQLGKKIQVRDAVASGHKSHIDLLTETDFDLIENAKDWKSKIQIEMIGDLLVISDKAKDELKAFRLGFYFDSFKQAKKQVGVKNKEGKKIYTKEKFIEKYGEKKAGASMHIGARYDFKQKKYQGAKIKKGITFGLWGGDGTRDNTGRFWENKIKEWDCGYLNDTQRDAVVTAFLADCKKLDMANQKDSKKKDKMHSGLMTKRMGLRIATDPRTAVSNKNRDND